MSNRIDEPDQCRRCGRPGDYPFGHCPLCLGGGHVTFSDELVETEEVSTYPRREDVDQLWSAWWIHQLSECEACESAECPTARRLRRAHGVAFRRLNP